MKKLIFSLLGIVALATLFTSCRKIVLEAGPLTVEVRDVDEEFSRVEISGSLDLLINKDEDAEVLRVEAGENLLEHIKTYVQNGTLFIDEETNNGLTSGIRRAYVSQEFLDKITMIGSGDVEAEGLSSEVFELEMEGSGDSEIEFLSVIEVDISMDGSGDCKLEGEGENIILGINGSGDCNARFYEALTATINVNGSGDVEVYSSEELVVNINGSGDVDYWGEPIDTLFNINGSGDINGHN